MQSTCPELERNVAVHGRCECEWQSKMQSTSCDSHTLSNERVIIAISMFSSAIPTMM